MAADFGDGPFVEFLKFLNRRESLLITKLQIRMTMKYLFGQLTGNRNFYKEGVTDSISFSKRLWYSVGARLQNLE